MYRELLTSLFAENSYASLFPPCPEHEIRKAERLIGCTFPAELCALLRETNGDGWFLLSAKEMIENVSRNRLYLRSCFETEAAYQKAIDSYLFFATNGCGDYYCCRILPDKSVDPTVVYRWEHEDFCVYPVASGLVDAIKKYYGNEI